MGPLFILLHSLAETGRVKVVGIYTSRKLAEAAEKRTRLLPGFAEEPEGFTIERYEVDEDHGLRGFVRLRRGATEMIGVEHHGPVLRLLLKNPPANALSLDLMEAFQAQLDAVSY